MAAGIIITTPQRNVFIIFSVGSGKWSLLTKKSNMKKEGAMDKNNKNN